MYGEGHVREREHGRKGRDTQRERVGVREEKRESESVCVCV